MHRRAIGLLLFSSAFSLACGQEPGANGTGPASAADWAAKLSGSPAELRLAVPALYRLSAESREASAPLVEDGILRALGTAVDLDQLEDYNMNHEANLVAALFLVHRFHLASPRVVGATLQATNEAVSSAVQSAGLATLAGFDLPPDQVRILSVLSVTVLSDPVARFGACAFLQRAGPAAAIYSERALAGMLSPSEPKGGKAAAAKKGGLDSRLQTALALYRVAGQAQPAAGLLAAAVKSGAPNTAVSDRYHGIRALLGAQIDPNDEETFADELRRMGAGTTESPAPN